MAEKDRDDGKQRRPRPGSFWSGTITFGLVSVPVDLFAGVRSSGGLRLLAPDGVPLRRETYCPADGRALTPDEIVRGVEVGDGEWVLVEDEELEALEPRRSREIDLRLFVARDALDPRLFRRPYLLAPSGDTSKAYRLLAAAMERTDRVGIATFVMRGRDHLVAILAENGVLLAEELRFAGELRPVDEAVDRPEAEPARAQVRRVEEQIEALAADELDPTELEDAETRRLEHLVARKRREGRDVVEVAGEVEEAEAREGRVIDISDLLARSLRERGADGGGARTGRKAPPAEATKQELYERARDLGIEGRSRMSKDELRAAIRRGA